jgi:MFS family permease
MASEANRESKPEPPLHDGTDKGHPLLVWTIVASQFAPPFMFSGVAVALPAMGTDLNAGAMFLGLVETLFLASQLAFLLPVGRFADASDKTTLYKLGLLGFGVASIVIGVLSSIPAILGIRFLQGVTSAVFAATGPAILADIVPAAQRGRAFGSAVGAAYAGLTLGPMMAGVLSDIWGWRAVFLVGAAPLLFASLLVHCLLPSSWRRPVQSVHLPSAVLVVVAVLCLVAGSAMVREGPVGYAYLLGGLMLASVFVLWQRRLAQPLVDVEALIRHRVLRNALVVQLLLYLNAFCSIFLLSLYMQVSLGHSANMAGQVLAIGTVVMAVTAPVAGRLADRYRPHLIASVGVAWVLVSALMATTLHARTSLMFVTLVLAAQGVGFGFFSAPNMTVIMSSVSADATSMASALGAKARYLGMLAGMLVTVVLIAVHIGNDPVEQHPIRLIGTMVTAFSMLAALTAVALVVCLLTRTRRQINAAN